MVVTISRQFASGVRTSGSASPNASARYVDREILTRAAATLGLEDERSLGHLEEQAPHWWDHVARVIGVGPPA
jgi:hypothetical protein